VDEHLVFFDHECPFCNRAVAHIIELDRQRRFVFAPLKGETAEQILSGPIAWYKQANSLVLLENYQSTERRIWIRSKAALRVYWLIGDGWKLVGILSFFPGFVGDFFYRWFAEHRHRFKLKATKEPGPKDRFLP
jgi:predicted DCC family thiol-disulfide oxidoreductase YuxK